ncbi:MAG TPA: flavin-dependent oxidoreductase [Thermomicrobiales bacterium]|nr:flavin-dependent oxidoreductase [Thermomicrobiales bacterium]
MKIIIAGCGIGGLTTALALHEAGIDVALFEQAREVRELGVGINLLPHAVKELAALGLLPALDEAGIRTRRLILMNHLGQPVWDDLRGTDAGYEFPQISIHRGKLQVILYRAVIERLGAGSVHTGHRLAGYSEENDRIVARFERRQTGDDIEVAGDALIGADGIHSTLRATVYPDEGSPTWNGIMLWRGATEWPAYADGRTMVIAGGNDAKLVIYPIHANPSSPDSRLTNWGVMARLGDGSAPPPRREDWSRPGRLDEALPFVRDRFQLDFIDPTALIEATDVFYEYPCCDRDPIPGWSFGRTTLLGDAAHPMYPTGSNGASQAILDARSLACHLSSGLPVAEALTAYERERWPVTSEIVLANRRGGPEGVIDVIEARAPDGFDDLDAVASYAERAAIVRGYASMAGFAVDQVKRT